MSNARHAALAVMAGAQSGALSTDALAALADAVLASEPVRLALAVRDGGPLAVRRAIELAALVLAAPVSLDTPAEPADVRALVARR